MIKFKRVSYKNLQAVGNMGITIDLDKHPTTMLSGQNGSGKSTVLESLAYGLFGKPLKKVNLAGLINTTNKKGLLVEVEFEKNGVDYKVIRGQKPNKLEFYVNGELVDQSAAAKDYQSKIEYVLGMDYRLFTQTLVLNKEKYVPFMEQGAAERRKIVEDILDISIFSVMNDVVKEESKTVALRYDDLTYQRQKLVERIAGQERLIEQARVNSQDIQGLIQDDINRLKADIALEEQKIGPLEQSLEEYRHLEAKRNKKQEALREMESIGSKFQQNIKSINEELSFYTTNNHCPTCHQGIEQGLKDQKEQEATAKIDGIRSHASQLATVYQNTKDELSVLQSQISQLGSPQSDLMMVKANIKRMIAEVESLSYKLEKARAESKESQFVAEKAATEQQLADLDAELTTVIEQKEAYDLCKTLLKDDGIKSAIVRDYIDLINLRVNEYLSAMDFHIALTLDENFNEKVGAVNREGFTYDNLSTGQKTRVSLAVWLALLEVASLKNSVVSNLLMLDEILENLDSEGVASFMKLVREKLPHKNVFVVTQRADEFADHFRSDVRFRLNEGFTEIVK